MESKSKAKENGRLMTELSMVELSSSSDDNDDKNEPNTAASGKAAFKITEETFKRNPVELKKYRNVFELSSDFSKLIKVNEDLLENKSNKSVKRAPDRFASYKKGSRSTKEEASRLFPKN
ncbi:hypothetical protein HELRODRAFT_165695 [Helobdella robusta]|uniref:Uncharacterized protein n=1 Tax=Helobdella robusta TaxID=6412 RepID=T1EX64_HELRO|nr:hypothetical protein HELRODRAFT_165695 [Helobdella robusta]ESN91642.1 hypothetical protein HELRODRAFT_165695 [Helobdella robusta]